MQSPRSSIDLCLCFAALASRPAHAGDIAAGRRKAMQWRSRHGLDGLSKLRVAPRLVGQPESCLIKVLNDLPDGVRQNEMMSIVAIRRPTPT